MKNFWYIGTPFLVLVPVVLAIIRCAGQRKKHLRSGAVICVLLGLMGLSGCATAGHGGAQFSDRDGSQ